MTNSKLFFFLFEIFIRQLRVCYFVAPSLTRGRVCNLLLLLALASVVPLGSESAGLEIIFYCPNSWDSPNLEGQVPVVISPRNRVAQIYPAHWVPFPSPLTTRRATKEVFYPASTREMNDNWQYSKFKTESLTIQLTNPITNPLILLSFLDSSRCWQCMLCPCRVRNTFLKNFWNPPFFRVSTWIL
jgi:hypothetical protein